MREASKEQAKEQATMKMVGSMLRVLGRQESVRKDKKREALACKRWKRRCPGLLGAVLVACCLSNSASAERPSVRLQRFLDRHLTGEARTAFLLPDMASEKAFRGSVEIELLNWVSTQHYRWVRMTPGPESMAATLVDVRKPRPYVPSWPGDSAGCRVYQATVSLDDYADLVMCLALLSRAGLRAVGNDEGKVAEWIPFGHVVIRAAERCQFDGTIGTALPLIPHPSVSQQIQAGAPFQGVLANLLLRFFEEECAGRWTLRPATKQGVARAGALLLGSLSGAKGFRRRYRVLALGALGYLPARKQLAAMVPRSGDDSDIRDALRQINLRAACVPGGPPPQELMYAYLGEDPWWAHWARDLMRGVYGDRFTDIVVEWFERMPSPGLRVRLLREVEELDLERAKDLARLGLAAGSAQMRVECARILRSNKTLLRIMSDKTLVSRTEFEARELAIDLLPNG